MRWRAFLIWLCLSVPVLAQDAEEPAVLVADDISITRERVLIARGNVEAYQGETRMSASEIRYDQATGQLSIEGPITIEDGDNIVILADQAEMSEDLRNGLLSGARIVLNEQLQLAAVEMARVGGRYSQLYKTAVTSCQICEDDPRPPLWQIRARRVIHDSEERQIYFDQAQLRIRSIPVFYFPRLRLPDPTLKRATGFLIPTLVSTSQLGVGVRVPYFIKLGEHRDLTLLPLITTNSRTLGFRYRQAFVSGRMSFDGAISRDDVRPGRTRGYLFGEGSFSLPNDFKLEFGLQSTTDEAYLKDYDFSDADRLVSFVAVSRTSRDRFQSLRYTNFRTLRDDEDNETIPTNVVDALWAQRFHPAGLGGEARLEVQGHVHYRTSKQDTDGPDTDLIVDGRDVYRINLDADWRRSWLIGGLETQARIGVSLDAFQVAQDATFPDSEERIQPHAALTLRYPFSRQSASGAAQLLEPVVQIAWSGDQALNVPNEESTRVEFDEGNLLALSRFSAPDRRETGLRAAIGVNWASFGPDNRELRLSFGQIFRETAQPAFTDTSGLSGTASDILVASQFKFTNGLAISARTLFDANFDLDKAEVRSGWKNKRIDLSGSYLWLARDLAEDRADRISEFTFDGSVRLNQEWTASANWRFDFDAGKAATTGVGLEYQNECVRVGFTVDRRFTSSTSVEPQTSLGLTVSLQGFATRPGTEKYMRACGKDTL